MGGGLISKTHETHQMLENFFAQYHQYARKNTPFSYSNKLQIQGVCKWYFCILECVEGSKRFCMMFTLSIA